MKITEQIEAYLRGEMTEKERAEFEQLRATDPLVDQQVVAHQSFIEQLKDYGDRHVLLSDLNAIHETIDIEAIKDEVLPKSFIVRKLWDKYRMNAAVAASVALLAVFGTLFSTGYFSKRNALVSGYNALRREMSKEVDRKIQRSKKELMQNIKAHSMQGPVSPGEYSGTGFALTSSGYIVTNNHVIDGADSIYIQDNNGNSYKARKVYAQPQYDIAVLQIIDRSFTSLKSLPYTFKKATADLGENVYTIGFPRDEYVLGMGYVSSRTGYKGDTVQYQIDIPVNSGNSGSPLLDSRGNILGIISGKENNVDGASFAVKSKYLLETLENAPLDLRNELALNKKNSLAGLKRTDQIKRMQDFVFTVKVY